MVAGIQFRVLLKSGSIKSKRLSLHTGPFREFVSSREAIEATQYNVRTLEAIGKSGVNCNLSVKMTQLGLDIDPKFCMENMRRILETAKNIITLYELIWRITHIVK